MTGGPAFPTIGRTCCEGSPGEYYEEGSNGMTLRDYFAAKAMQAMVDRYNDCESVARQAYDMADAMLKARGSHD